MTFDWKEKEIKKNIQKTKRQFDSTQTCFSLTGDIPSYMYLERQYFEGAQLEFYNTALASSKGVNVFK